MILLKTYKRQIIAKNIWESELLSIQYFLDMDHSHANFICNQMNDYYEKHNINLRCEIELIAEI